VRSIGKRKAETMPRAKDVNCTAFEQMQRNVLYYTFCMTSSLLAFLGGLKLGFWVFSCVGVSVTTAVTLPAVMLGEAKDV
jgi:hypothetical protein